MSRARILLKPAKLLASCLVAIGVGAAALVVPAKAETTLTLWSHWADQQTKVAFVEEAVKRFEAKNPGVKVKVTWYQKGPLVTALQSALRAGKGPDIFYADPDQTHYIDNNLILPLDGLLNTEALEPWAKQVWTVGGKLYALPLEAQTIELYDNKELMKRFGYELPAGGQLTQAQFLDLVKKSAAAGVTPLVAGVADRDYPGAYLLHELLLKKLGKDDYGRLLDGHLSYKDPRVVAVFQYVRDLVDAGGYPKSLTSMKLGESHSYFYGSPGGLMLPMGSFYTSRAFNPPDKGGQPVGFPLGITAFPKMDGGACNDCKTMRVGGSFVVNANTKEPKLAAALLNEMATPDMAVLWVSTILGQTGVKTPTGAVTGQYAAYFKDLDAANAKADYFIGMPLDHLKGNCLDTYRQVMNTGFPAGLLSVDQATDMMDAACSKKS